MVETLPSNAEAVGPFPGQGGKIPLPRGQKKKKKTTQIMKQKQYCNILIKSLKMVHIKNLSHVFYQNFEKHTETLMVNDYLNCKRVSLF